MTDFPESEIQRLYGLGLSFVAKIKGGYLSDNYELTDGSTKYFLKRHRHKDAAHVVSLCEVEQFFADAGIPVILPLPTRNGSKFFEVDNRWWSLYPFVPGKNVERGLLSEVESQSLGHMLGLIHRRGKESTLAAPDAFRPWKRKKLPVRIAAVEAEIAKESPLSEFGKLALENMRIKKEWFLANEVPYEQFDSVPKGLIHGDYFSDNVFFSDQGQVSYVYDFEKADYAIPAFEVFRSMFVSFFSIPSDENLHKAKLYLDAYLQSNPTAPEQVRAGFVVAYLKQMNSVWMEEEHYLKGNTRADPIFASQCAAVRFLIEQQATIEQTLLG